MNRDQAINLYNKYTQLIYRRCDNEQDITSAVEQQKRIAALYGLVEERKNKPMLTKSHSMRMHDSKGYVVIDGNEYWPTESSVKRLERVINRHSWTSGRMQEFWGEPKVYTYYES